MQVREECSPLHVGQPMQTFRIFQRILTTFRGRKSLVKFVPACQGQRSLWRGNFTTSPSWALGFLALAMLAMPSRAVAQAGTTGAISGIITDSQGGAVPQADVTAKSMATAVTSRTTTNAEGVYTFPYMPIGVLSAAQAEIRSACDVRFRTFPASANLVALVRPLYCTCPPTFIALGSIALGSLE